MENNMNQYYKKLELDQIFSNYKDNLHLEDNINKVDYLKPYQDLDALNKLLDQVDEALVMIYKYQAPDILFTSRVKEVLDLTSKGGICNPIDLYEVLSFYYSINSCRRLLDDTRKNKESYKYFTEYVESLSFDDNFIRILRDTVDEEGTILDTASVSLRHVRSKIKNIDDRIRQKLNDIISSKGDFLSDTVIVKRDGRFCVAVKSEHKRTFNGIIHDTSSTHLTTYMEPYPVYELSNEKDELINEEKEEINQILRKLSNDIMLRYDELTSSYHTFLIIDDIFGRAKLAKSYDGERQHINNEGILNLINARHPLLKVKKVIPNTLKFDNNFLGIVITGPNTGGKTVFLKTVGLLSLMTKFGFLIPASKESNVMLFDKIYCDIGDDQSIQENLSTFSSHMKRMVDITNNVTPNSLALFDEIGSGTDPADGANIALSVLNYFINNKISFIVTTHYSELKAFAYGNDLVVNASMAFDKDTNNPTYHLEIGKSGSSNALAIAKNLGLRDEIINAAIDLSKKNNTDIKDLMEKLETAKDETVKLNAELKVALEEASNKKSDYEKKINYLEQDKEKILLKAKNDANKIIDDTRIKAKELVSELDEALKNTQDLPKVIELKHKVNEFDNINTVKKKTISSNHEFVVGDQVYLLNYENYGIIKRIKGSKYDVEIGNITIKVSKSDMKYVEKEEKLKGDVAVNMDASSRKISLTLDLRGMTVADAKEALDKYLDDLIICNLHQASIIHGFGTGRVREMVQDYVRKSKDILSFRYGTDKEGGFGVTVITLK